MPSRSKPSSTGSRTTLEGRVSRVEEAIIRMEASQEALQSSMRTSQQTMTDSITRLERVMESRRPNNSTIIGFLTLIFMGGGALWGLAIRPQDVQQQLKFKEVETQFRLASAIRNEERQFNHMLMQVVWRETFGTDLPGYTYFPEVTAHKATE